MGIRLEDLSFAAQKKALEQVAEEERKKKGNKYHNEKTENSGIRFDSKKEAARFETLRLRMAAGEIRNLKLQQDFTLQEAYTLPNGERVRAIRYRADFCYEELHQEERWVLIVEDVKSRATRTREYSIKRKLMLEKYNIQIQEV